MQEQLQMRYLIVLTAILLSCVTYAQDLEPRVLSEAPTGMNVVLGSYAYSTGNVLLDSSLPLEDAETKIHSMVFAYARSFKMWGLPTKFDAIIPYAFGNYSGILEDVEASTDRNGLADPSFRISTTFLGAEAKPPWEFAKRKKNPFRMGAVLRVRVPLGQYEQERLINLGTNRFGLKLGLAASYTFWDKLIFELHANSWFFTKNKKYFGDNTLAQDPLLSFQTHITYLFGPRFWTALSLGRSALGETSLNGEERNDLQNNSRAGLTFSYRVHPQHSLKFATSTGVTTRYGADFTSFVVAYQFLWFDKPKQKQADKSN
mgnify:CR=1 FL=1